MCCKRILRAKPKESAQRTRLRSSGDKGERMKIILDERYDIEPYQYGFVLRDLKVVTTRKNKEGKEVSDKGIIGYYGGLESTVAAYVRISLNETLGDVSVHEYLAAYKKQVDRITGFLPKVEK